VDIPGGELDANGIQHFAREWWRERVENAEAFIYRRYSSGLDISISERITTANIKTLQMPTLEEVMRIFISLLDSTA
jgi:hypothetical protein